MSLVRTMGASRSAAGGRAGRAWSLSSCAANACPKPSQAGAKPASSAVALPKKRRALSCCPTHR